MPLGVTVRYSIHNLRKGKIINCSARMLALAYLP